MSEPRILIVSSKFGGGHYQAGEALAEGLRAVLPDNSQVRHCDYGSFFPIGTDFLMRTAYLKIVKTTPSIWGKIYKYTNTTHAENKYRNFLKGFRQKSFIHFIREMEPDIIVNTHFMSAGVLAELKRKGLIKVPVVTVVTDYVIHGMWIHPGIDLYIVGCRQVQEKLIEAGIKEENIIITGIPVRLEFDQEFDKVEMRQKMGFDPNKTTILFMGGAYGPTSKASEIIRAINELDPKLPLQFIIVAGKDVDFYYGLKQAEKECRFPLKCLGYVKNVEELMAASDLLVSKGGALTITEALTLGLPIVIYKPIPGQEDGNAEFVESSGGGIAAQSTEELVRVLSCLLQKHDVLKEMSELAKETVPCGSSRKAAQAIINLKNQSENQFMEERLSTINAG